MLEVVGTNQKDLQCKDEMHGTEKWSNFVNGINSGIRHEPEYLRRDAMMEEIST